MKPKKYLSGENVAFLNPFTGLIDEGVIIRYVEIDEDDNQEDYRVSISYEKKEIITFETNIYKVN